MWETMKFYVVVCNAADKRWRTRLFEDTIAGTLAYPKRKDADDAMKKAKQIYGWAKVLPVRATILRRTGMSDKAKEDLIEKVAQRLLQAYSVRNARGKPDDELFLFH